MVPTEHKVFYDEHPFDWAPFDGTVTIESLVSPPACRLDRDARFQLSNSSILDAVLEESSDFSSNAGSSCIGIDSSRVSINLR